MSTVLSHVTIEPFYFLYFLSITLATSGTGLLYPVKICLQDFPDYAWYKDKLDILGVKFRSRVEQRIVCLQLEDNKYLEVIREFFGPDCETGTGNMTAGWCDEYKGSVTATENHLLNDAQE